MAALRTEFTIIALAALVGSIAACGAVGTPDGPVAAPQDQVAELQPADTVAPVPAPRESSALEDGRFPSDFAVDITVLLGPGAKELLTVQDRQAKYVLLPDGSLHADASPFIDISTRPGRTRWLYEDQMQFLWSLSSQMGFTNASTANGPPNPDLLTPRRGERLAIITYRAGGRTWTFVRRAADDSPMDPAVARLIRAFAVLSWIPDFFPDEILPERYDFGPDPYAVYREIRSRQPYSFR